LLLRRPDVHLLLLLSPALPGISRFSKVFVERGAEKATALEERRSRVALSSPLPTTKRAAHFLHIPLLFREGEREREAERDAEREAEGEGEGEREEEGGLLCELLAGRLQRRQREGEREREVE
jgi:hypothetical protein